MNDFDTAITHLETSISIFREIENRLGDAHFVGYLGVTLQRSGYDYEKARNHLNEAIQYINELGVSRDFNIEVSLACCEEQLGNKTKAKQLALKSLSLAKKQNITADYPEKEQRDSFTKALRIAEKAE